MPLLYQKTAAFACGKLRKRVANDLTSKYNKPMRTDNTIFLMGRIREKADCYLRTEMEKIGLSRLAPSHGDILANLFKYCELSMASLAEVVHRDPSTVTALVNKLRQRGFVRTRKDETDSRITLVELTEKGCALEPAFQTISQSLCEMEYRGMTQDERQQLKRLLTKVDGNFNR